MSEADADAIEAVSFETTDDAELTRPDHTIPDALVALPLNQRPVFPSMMLPMVVPPGRLADAVRLAKEHHDGWLGFFLTKTPLDDNDDLAAFELDDLRHIGAAARIAKFAEHESGGVQVLAQVVGRFAIAGAITDKPHLIVRGAALRSNVDREDPEIRAYAMAIVTALKDLVEHNPVFADEIRLVLANYNNIDGPGRLADLAATLTTANRDDLQAVLEEMRIPKRMERVLVLLARERELAELKGKIQSQIEDKVSEQQRKFFLNEQLKAIKSELGIETDAKSLEIERFRERLAEVEAHLSDEAREAIDDELGKLSMLEPASSEYGVSRNRLDWLLSVPWGHTTDDNLDLVSLRQGLDADHHGLSDIKDRIVEFVAVRRLNQERGGGIVCLVGPPGTGKTSIGASIARQLGRQFYRLSLGGMRDEAEIKGHRRTYVGALPGKLTQALKRTGSMNPVIMLDEIDKLSRGIQGDPAATLLEVLDPEQNNDFLDHYLDVRLDLSQVLFVCTANDISTIPEPLRDRMEIIRLAGYVEDEKVAIAHRYLVPKQRREHGLTTKDISFTKTALRGVVRGYAREAGVRRLEQLVARICRKVATAKAEHESLIERGETNGNWAKVSVKPDTLTEWLGQPYLSDDELMAEAVPGVVSGLAWTAMGGATLEIEAVAIPAESGGFQLSGQLGDVMKESAGLARSYLRAHAERLGIANDWFDRHLIHIHVPAGATPKDGPSAGITMATAMASLALGKPVKRRLGMTGELTLTGRVYPIGGVREKLIAARRSGITTAILPKANQRDVDELDATLIKGLTLHFVSELDEVLAIAGLA